MTKRKRVLISGIAPGSSGVGRVIEYLIENSTNITVVHPPMTRKFSIINSLKNMHLLELLRSINEFVSRFVKSVFFKYVIFSIRNRDIIIIHPQTLGFGVTRSLISRNRAYIYVMDNSFFCIKSYNYLSSTQQPCMLCLGGEYINAALNGCESFPVQYSYKEYYDFINYLRENAGRLKFYAQNEGQVSLLKQQFGQEIDIFVIGLVTSDLISEMDSIEERGSPDYYDVVFHGDHTYAKGSQYIFKLTMLLENYSFLFPFDRPKGIKTLENVRFEKMNWSSGLKQSVVNSKLTLCPSIWSAPIEGSVMKTLKLGVPLAVYDAPFSFGREINNDAVIKLTGDLDVDFNILNNFLIKSNGDVGLRGKQFAINKINEMVDKLGLIIND